MSEPHFDLHQFADHPKAVSAETGISFNDYRTMHIQRRCKPVLRRHPEKIAWAFDDAKLRNVILTFLERRFFILSVPSGATDEERIAAIELKAKSYETDTQRSLDKMLDLYKQAKEDGAPEKRLRELEIEAQIQDSKAMFNRRPVELLTNLVYMSYRLGYDAATVAEQLHILSPHVRILLMRLNILAADLEEGRPYRQRSSLKRQKSRPWTPQELRKLWFLRASGLSWAKCAKALGRGRYYRGYGYHNTGVRVVYERYFEQPLPVKAEKTGSRKPRRWTPDRLRALWLLRHTGHTWQQCGKFFGITGSSVYGRYKRHLSGKA